MPSQQSDFVSYLCIGGSFLLAEIMGNNSQSHIKICSSVPEMSMMYWCDAITLTSTVETAIATSDIIRKLKISIIFGMKHLLRNFIHVAAIVYRLC